MKRHTKPSHLRYTGGPRRNSTARAHYLPWRKLQEPPIPERCDNPACQFHNAPLIWNGKALPLVLEHINAVSSDNRTSNLRLLCPNCDAQNSATKGGANKGRVLKYAGGFCLVDPNGARSYVMPVEAGHMYSTVKMSRSLGRWDRDEMAALSSPFAYVMYKPATPGPHRAAPIGT